MNPKPLLLYIYKGWVNPALYALAGNFSHDIVSGMCCCYVIIIITDCYYSTLIIVLCHFIYTGNNKCCAGRNLSTIVCCVEGFDSVVGWDPVVGFGTIDFPKFLQTLVAFNGLPVSAPSPSSSSSAGLSTGAIAGIVK